MKWSRQREQYWGPLESGESRFEQLDIGAGCENLAQAHFGRKLQKLFPVPDENSEPENIRALLSKIQNKLDNLSEASEAAERRPRPFEARRLASQQA